MTAQPGGAVPQQLADEDSLAERIGARLRRIRRDQGLTLAALSQRCGVSVSYLSAVEKGVNHPSLPTLAAITEALGVRIPEVLAHEGRPTVVRAAVPAQPGSIAVTHPQLALRGIVVVAASGEDGPCPVELAGRSLFLYLIDGELELDIDGAAHQLDAGDALDAPTPRRVTWSSPRPSSALWVSCPARPS